MAFHRMMLAAGCMLAFGCGGGESSDGPAPATVPTDTSVEGLTAFLDEEHYKQAGWQAETSEPRDVDSTHGNGQVHLWMNEIAIAGQEEDPDDLPVDSMAVKELYADGDRVGVAAMLKTDEGSSAAAWLFFCYGPAGRCSHGQPEHSIEDPLYATGLGEDCGYCHPTVVTTFPR